MNRKSSKAKLKRLPGVGSSALIRRSDPTVHGSSKMPLEFTICKVTAANRQSQEEEKPNPARPTVVFEILRGGQLATWSERPTPSPHEKNCEEPDKTVHEVGQIIEQDFVQQPPNPNADHYGY